MGVPKIEWREIDAGTEYHRIRAEPDGVELICDNEGHGWQWHMRCHEAGADAPTTGSGFYSTIDEARDACEYAFSREWKARQYDAAQKHEAELLSVAKVMYDLLVGIRQLGGHGGPVDDGFGGWEEGVALKARCQAAIKNAEGSK